MKQAWFRRFTDNGLIHGGSRQCLYVRPLALRLLPAEAAQRAADQLNGIVEANRYRIGTGFLSTPFLCEVLTRGGHTETAYRTLLNSRRVRLPGFPRSSGLLNTLSLT